MLQYDPEFYRKWLAVVGNVDKSAHPMKMTVIGQKANIYAKGLLVGELGLDLFHRLSVFEIINMLGVPRNERVITSDGS